ncbi:unnamed protein product [Coregonus sp. 'balchen']|uniref:uncharacterized protein si:ch211-12e13.1 n=1 Tax=Coregonus clupeaformis TaxID=59861 RepID=UPI0013E4D96E|nr:uncharacterized protein si:ch211-12e13.1 [Coregonus clupeaformis]CAB1319511.1 unnamed protein product [Coregonus sp. 'balchen']
MKMGNIMSNVFIAGLPLYAIYFLYANIYCSYKLLKANVVFDSRQRIPCFAYLFLRYVFRALIKRQGHLYFCDSDVKGEVAFTIFNCRFNKDLLRRFCNAAGYGWDYPDIEFRDIPLCYPETLCLRMLDILISDEKFRLSPLGLVRVRQSLRTWQPIDELKKGPFMLQARVLEYRVVEDGVEVDISLTAISRTDQPVWESVLTMLSQDRGRTPSTQPIPEWYDGHLDTSESDDIMKAVDINVPWTTGLKSVWAFSDYSPHCLLTIPAKLSGYRCTQTPGLWMLSKCLAEIEKHKGVDAIRAPISVTAQFKEPLLVAGKVTIKFCESVGVQSSSKCVSFQMEQYGRKIPHIKGQICRTTVEDVN